MNFPFPMCHDTCETSYRFGRTNRSSEVSWYVYRCVVNSKRDDFGEIPEANRPEIRRGHLRTWNCPDLTAPDCRSQEAWYVHPIEVNDCRHNPSWFQRPMSKETHQRPSQSIYIAINASYENVKPTNCGINEISKVTIRFGQLMMTGKSSEPLCHWESPHWQWRRWSLLILPRMLSEGRNRMWTIEMTQASMHIQVHLRWYSWARRTCEVHPRTIRVDICDTYDSHLAAPPMATPIGITSTLNGIVMDDYRSLLQRQWKS